MAKNNKPKEIPSRLYKEVVRLMSKAYSASHKVLEENRKLGIPSPFALNGRIYYLMPDGRIKLKSKSKRFHRTGEGGR